MSKELEKKSAKIVAETKAQLHGTPVTTTATEDCPPCRMSAAIGLSMKVCETLKEKARDFDCKDCYDDFVTEMTTAEKETDPAKAQAIKLAAADKYFDRMITKVTPVDSEQGENLKLLRELMHGKDPRELVKIQEARTKMVTEEKLTFDTPLSPPMTNADMPPVPTEKLSINLTETDDEEPDLDDLPEEDESNE